MSIVMGIYVNFTKTIRQIWLCLVNLASNFEIVIFCLILYQILGNLPNLGEIGPRTKNVTSKKHIGGGKHPLPPPPPPPSAYRINISECKSLYSKMQLKFECISNASIVIAYYIFLQK